MTSNHKTHFLVKVALLAAMSVILVYLIHFPIFPPAPFLEYDPADIPILIGTFMFGPAGGLIITVIAAVVQGLTVSAESGVIGIFMHIVATGSFVIVAGLIYWRMHTKRGAIVALIVGSLVMAAAMCLWNYLVTPIYMGTPRAAVAAMIPTVILPFNLIKAGINSVITFFVYKTVSRFDVDLGKRVSEKKAKRAKV